MYKPLNRFRVLSEAFVCSLAALVAISTPSQATPATATSTALLTVTARDTDHQGHLFPTTVRQFVTKVSASGNVSTYRATIVIGVVTTGSLKPSGIRPLNASAGCQDDGSISVEDCITLNYNVISNCHFGFRCVNITSSNIQYNNLDTHDAVLDDGDWTEGISGPCYSGIGCSGGTPFYSGTHDFGNHVVTSGTVYTYTGFWSGKYTLINNAVGDMRGGISSLYWAYRGNARTLTYQLNIPD